jgi:hypothetical protein
MSIQAANHHSISIAIPLCHHRSSKLAEASIWKKCRAIAAVTTNDVGRVLCIFGANAKGDGDPGNCLV